VPLVSSPSRTKPLPRSHILALAPYARSERPAGRAPILLAQNENASPASPAALAAARAALGSIGRYPDADATPLRQAIAAAEGLDVRRIMCGAGSMELISLVAQAYLRPGDEVVISQYGYLYFRTATALCEATIVLAPEREFHADVDAMLERVGPRTRLVFLANPNNPTGTLLPRAEVARLRAGLRDDIVLVIDAAYAEYVTELDYNSGTEIVDGSENSVMLRTFSKAHGLAGLRVGWGYFPESIAAVLERIRLLNNVTGPGLAAAAAAITDRAHLAAVQRENALLRQAFAAEMREAGFAPVPGHGNFMLLPFASAQAAASAYRFLASRNIYVRPMAPYGLDALRVTIGTRAELSAVREALVDWSSTTPEIPA
jgi:histidinol-phosphate aminotransferase